MVFAARRSYASAVLGVLILSVCPSVTRVLCDYAAADKISTDLRRRVVRLQELSYLLINSVN